MFRFFIATCKKNCSLKDYENEKTTLNPYSFKHKHFNLCAGFARTTSTILVATGPVIAAGGIGILIYGLADKVGYIDYYDVNGSYVRNTKNHNNEIIIGSAVTLVGIAAALYSIHFSKKASDLKREARKAKLKATTDRISIPGLQNGFANNRARQCKLSLIVPLGR